MGVFNDLFGGLFDFNHNDKSLYRTMRHRDF